MHEALLWRLAVEPYAVVHGAVKKVQDFCYMRAWPNTLQNQYFVF
jgi:hypothetical protein